MMDTWVPGDNHSARSCQPVPAAVRHRAAGQQRIDRAGRDHGRGGASSRRRRSDRRTDGQPDRQDRLYLPFDDADAGWFAIRLCRARTLGRGGHRGAARARSPRSSSRSARIITATRIPAAPAFPMASRRRPAGALSLPDAANLERMFDARAADHDEAGADAAAIWARRAAATWWARSSGAIRRCRRCCSPATSTAGGTARARSTMAQAAASWRRRR